MSLGLCHDGGDAETGTGVEVGAGLAWSDPSRGITSDLRLYGLAAHEDGGYEEWGASGSLRIAPDPSGRGMSLSMTPSWGAERQGGRIWDTRPSALGDEGGERPGARLDVEFGYGLSLPGGLTGTPYMGLRAGGAGTTASAGGLPPGGGSPSRSASRPPAARPPTATGPSTGSC